MATGVKLWHTLTGLGRNREKKRFGFEAAGENTGASDETKHVLTTALPDQDEQPRTKAEESEVLPWEEADLTSDEDVRIDTVTPERRERIRRLADEYARAGS